MTHHNPFPQNLSTGRRRIIRGAYEGKNEGEAHVAFSCAVYCGNGLAAFIAGACVRCERATTFRPIITHGRSGEMKEREER